MKAPTTMEWLRAAADRVSVGSARLVTHHIGRTVRAVRRRVSSWPWWVQLGLALLVLKGGLPVMTGLGNWAHRKAEASGSTLFIAAALWLLAAYRAGHPDWKPKGTEAAEPEDPPAPDEPVEEQPEPASASSGPWPISPTELVATVRDIGTPHAQLKPIAEHLRSTTDAVRAAAAGMGWPVKDVRMDNRSSSAGLRWDECPSPESVYPDTDVVGAGQPADDNDDDTAGRPPREGLRVKAIGEGGRLVHDAADTIRHYKITAD
ncbi:hypothetical protein [Streptomyces sp. NBC_00645]|uniref:hypothetical protein n=1 Tax=Streptomyces sp. NBC_00645 TaxID=2975795 RepID=UPI00324CEA3C